MCTKVIRIDCGCEVEMLDAGYKWHFCPLHKAAPDMYEALKEFEEATNNVVKALNDIGESCPASIGLANEHGRQALALARAKAGDSI